MFVASDSQRAYDGHNGARCVQHLSYRPPSVPHTHPLVISPRLRYPRLFSIQHRVDLLKRSPGGVPASLLIFPGLHSAYLEKKGMMPFGDPILALNFGLKEGEYLPFRLNQSFLNFRVLNIFSTLFEMRTLFCAKCVFASVDANAWINDQSSTM